MAYVVMAYVVMHAFASAHKFLMHAQGDRETVGHVLWGIAARRASNKGEGVMGQCCHGSSLEGSSAEAVVSKTGMPVAVR